MSINKGEDFMKLKKLFLYILLAIYVLNLVSCSTNNISNANTTTTKVKDKTGISNSSTQITEAVKSSVQELFYYPSPESGIVKINSDGTGKKQVLENGLNGGILLIKSGWIYFISTQDTMLHKIKTDGTENSKLPGDISCWELNADQNYLYFIGNDHMLYKLKVDGTDKADKVKLYDESVYDFDLNNNTLYFKTSESLFSMDTSGSNIKNFNIPRVEAFNVVGDYLVYSQNYENNEIVPDLYSYNLKTKKKILIAKTYSNFVLSSSKLVYSNNSKELHISNLDGSSDKVIYKCKGMDMNIESFVSNRIYFQDGNTNGFCNGDYFSINSDGSNLMKLPKLPHSEDSIRLVVESNE